MKRLFWIDAVRVLSILMVVTIHVSAKILYNWNLVLEGTVSASAWNFANALNSISRISVPLFVMLSGALLLNNKERMQIFLQKRLPRIVIPWVFWSVILFFYSYGFSVSEDFRIFESFSKVASVVFSSGFASKAAAIFFGGFWFMPMIFGLYLITPILKKFTKTAKKKEYRYFFLLWFTTASLLPTLNQTFGIPISFNLPLFIQYSGYFVGGYYLAYKLHQTPFSFQLTKIIFLTSLANIAIGTYCLTIFDGKLHESLYSYTNMFVVTASFSGFIVLKNFFSSLELQYKKVKSWKKNESIIRKISVASFGVFLVHSIVLDIFDSGITGISISANSTVPFIALPITVMTVFSSSLVLILTLKKVNSKLFG